MSFLAALARQIAESVATETVGWARWTPLDLDSAGWLTGDGVEHIPAHPSWYPALRTPDGVPLGITLHYTSTDHGTARGMARRRVRPFNRRRHGRPISSWHVTVAHDGRLWQSIPFTEGAYHCLATGPARRLLRGVPEWPAEAPGAPNLTTVGVEIEGHGDAFPDAQVDAVARLVGTLVRVYEIPESLALLHHSALDPARRGDPGRVWRDECEPRVRAAVFGARP